MCLTKLKKTKKVGLFDLSFQFKDLKENIQKLLKNITNHTNYCVDIFQLNLHRFTLNKLQKK